MRVLFGRRLPRSGGVRARAMGMGLWLVAGVIATVGAAVSVPSSGAPESARVQAGPVDDTIDYLDCLIRLLQGLECDDDVQPEPNPTPIPDPEEVDPIE